MLCIPASPFFSRERASEGASDEFVRIAFCKTDDTIEASAAALKGLMVNVDEESSIVVEQRSKLDREYHHLTVEKG